MQLELLLGGVPIIDVEDWKRNTIVAPLILQIPPVLCTCLEYRAHTFYRSCVVGSGQPGGCGLLPRTARGAEAAEVVLGNY